MAKRRTTYMMSVRTGKPAYLSRYYRPGTGVRLISMQHDGFDQVIHEVSQTDNTETKVSTVCGITRFVTYSQGTKKKPNCIHCLAASS